VEKERRYWRIIFYKYYFEEFFIKQRDKVKDKIIWTLDLIEELERVPEIILSILKIQPDFMKSGYRQDVIFFAFSVFRSG
jgi:hypothetical protein